MKPAGPPADSDAPSRSQLEAAARVISQSDRDHPADAVLRQAARTTGQGGGAQTRRGAQLVFAYYRWRGWLDPRQTLSRQVAEAWDWQRRFMVEPDRFAEEELRQRAVPDWIHSLMTAPGAWLRALQCEPPLWLRARPGTGPALGRDLGHCQPAGPGVWADALRYSGTEDLFRSAAFHAGAFEVQDLSSQIVGWMCGPQPGETWWDVCAGEGGKTLHLADLMANRGRVWATDRADWRLRVLKRRAGRAQLFNYRLAPWDGTSTPPVPPHCDGVLLDAPCSGVGTWQRNPHARWTTTARDVMELADVQRRLLEHAAGAVKNGGRLVYAVCTLTRPETESVAEAFARAHPEFQPEPLELPGRKLEARGEVPGAAGRGGHHPPIPSGGSGSYWIWPQDYASNGMFIAVWRRQMP